MYLTFLRNVWGSFSARSLVIWSPQVAGGDEPPSVLSDNLPKVWLIEPDLFHAWADLLGPVPCALRVAQPTERSITEHSKVTNSYRKVLRSEEGWPYGWKRLVSVSL